MGVKNVRLELRRAGCMNPDESFPTWCQTKQMLPNARFAIRGHQIPTLLYTPRTIAAFLVQGHKVEIGRLCQQPEISRFMFRGRAGTLKRSHTV